ncbi:MULTISPECIES: peroxiredoxin-like family protein [unclassified Mesorhizobium]|uniref:peroxiredoxin-like family protein n=1 Tax=unclassified Mesorhizobium TaxID=325217 RepID=UPI00112E7A1D|nr:MULTISPECIES: peroxiredoxin-like family protein [unclassified Mesorhizobium]MBZ9894582.1 AhpC/TSA family protein [Mesorhizobium sp. BR1-1-6]TPM57491.1 AhpC/TSA family protein [Mesorhizobium sp. B2-2-4]TPM65706.1 AhpC/TSA family protein [Mesorhizobium sp. B2-2-1]TPN38384.1 AhpC/TSA family protein [Mesorhizobium sp. B1-1-6]TPN72031.1 AhpC/TSA family protein [Mesorhizobium sp. B1-1-3]
MLLQDQLDAVKAADLARTPPNVTLVRQRAVEALAASGLAERATQAGEQAPSFRLRDGNGRAFSSREALRHGPMVLVFYRGRWCPYCTVDLRAIESASRDIRSLGASLVVVSQQTADNSLETQRRNALSFASLVDAGGKVAHAFGLRWKASDELRTVEQESGLDLATFNGDASWTLTMPARYVVARDGTIEYADISVDYTRRGDPSELIPVLAHLAAGGGPCSRAPESVSARPNQ